MPQISLWKSTGMPFGENGRIPLDVATRWLRQWERREKMKASGTDAGQRVREAEAELMELRLARELGEVVLASEARAAAAAEITRVRTTIQQMASTCAQIIAVECGCDVRTAARGLRKSSDVVLAQLANGDAEEEAA